MNPDQTAPKGLLRSSLIRVHNVCNLGFSTKADERADYNCCLRREKS